MTRVSLVTANTPGAVAILELHGQAVEQTLNELTGRAAWPQRRAALCRFADIDEGLAILVDASSAQLMPHGGPRVVQKLIEHLTTALGCTYDPAPDPQTLYPEANSPIEADLLDAIARATSPAAIDLLAAQFALWRAVLQHGGITPDQRQAITKRSRILDRLITPPTVVVVGPANAGKSTLTNALMGKTVSIVADLPGTTRDWVGGLVELSSHASTEEAIAVHWLDTPGLRQSDDAIEQRAIALAQQQIARADVLIVMRDPDQTWPDASVLPRTPDLWVVNKADDALDTQSDSAGSSSDEPLMISAIKQLGLDKLQQRVAAQLSLESLSAAEPWAFSPTLKQWCAASENEPIALDSYLTID